MTQELVAGILAGQLGVPTTSLTVRTPFYELGLDSVSGIRLLGVLEEHLGMELDPMLLLDYPSIETLAARLDQLKVESSGAGVLQASDRFVS